jgi:hypothetical protein
MQVATHFLNVDLDIYSKSDLQPLADGFGRKVTVMYVGKLKGTYCAHLEVARYTRSADATIRAFCKLIEALPKDLRTLWDAATVRSFSIGIQAGTHPDSSDFVVGPKAVKAVSDVAAQIVITIYAPEQFRTGS